MRPVGQVQPGLTPLDAAENQVANRIEADGVQIERMHGGGDFGQREGLEQPQHLDVLSGGALEEPRFQ